jgi:hypothetical protein
VLRKSHPAGRRQVSKGIRSMRCMQSTVKEAASRFGARVRCVRPRPRRGCYALSAAPFEIRAHGSVRRRWVAQVVDGGESGDGVGRRCRRWRVFWVRVRDGRYRMYQVTSSERFEPARFGVRVRGGGSAARELRAGAGGRRGGIGTWDTAGLHGVRRHRNADARCGSVRMGRRHPVRSSGWYGRRQSKQSPNARPSTDRIQGLR